MHTICIKMPLEFDKKIKPLFNMRVFFPRTLDDESPPFELNFVVMVCFCSRLNGQQRLWKSMSTSARERATQYQPGQRIHGFTVREVRSNLIVTITIRFFSRGNIVHMESFSNLSYVNIRLIGAIGQFLIARRRPLNHLPFKFLFVQVVAVPDLFLTAVKLSHDKTGAQYLHAARDDSNNLFRFGARQCLLEPLLSELPTLTASSLFPQRPVQNHSPGQHGGPAHPGAHGAVRV